MRQTRARRRGLVPALFPLAVGFFAAWPAHAQEGREDTNASPPAQGPADAVVPPRLVDTGPPIVLDPAQSGGQRVEVELRLTIDAEGAVTAAEVLAPVGREPEMLARTAALQFRFEPALRDGKPVACRILYGYVFAPPPPSESAGPVQEPPPTAALAIAAKPSGAATAAERPEAAEPIEVSAGSKKSEAERLQQSAEAVLVVDTRRAQERAADMGAVLARTQGISVRRSGGLGSDTRVFLNGLYGDQIRFFIDGVPLRLAGYPLDVANVPVNFIDRFEVYRGVVPIRFGADALGGAINLVTNQSYETRLGASYQVGSFGTHRINASGRHRHGDLVFGAAAFFDATQNNYDVDVEVPGPGGRQVTATVPRFHDRYLAYGANAEVGVVDKPWARRLLLKAFQTGFDKEFQSNNVMEVPYGEVTTAETIRGATARYEVSLASNVDLDVVGSYAHRTIEFTDKSRWVYNWFGQRVRERDAGSGGLARSAEANEEPTDDRYWQHGFFARTLLSWTVRPGHVLRAVVTPSFTTRTGDGLIQPTPTAFDPLVGNNSIFTLVSGVEYESNWFDARLSNIVFVKDYVYDADGEDPVEESARFRDAKTFVHRPGFGDSLRFRVTPWLLVKASYEYATRLPEVDEVFGNGQLISPNLDLQPETSHNFNAGPRFEFDHKNLGLAVLDVNAFVRDTDNWIFPLIGPSRAYYDNVYSARTQGVEGGASWSTRDRSVNLNGTLTWQDLRNRSNSGAFGRFEGDRIPNRPYFFGSWGANVRLPPAPGSLGSVFLYYQGRYVHGYFRSWESAASNSSQKQTIPDQTTHDVGLTWSVTNGIARVASTFEVQNVGDAKVYDEFGIQRPGRAYYVKVTGEL